MEASAAPGAGLLWAFELHRENQVLSKRLTAIETTIAKQQEQITTSEQNAHSTQKESVDALDYRLKKLEHNDPDAQIEGLTGDLQSTQRQLERMQEKMTDMEMANARAESKSKDKNHDVERRLDELTSTLTRTDDIVHGFEDRLELATDHDVRSTVQVLELSIERNTDENKNLSDQLCRLQQAQDQLRALLESAKQNHREDSTLPASAERNTVKDTRKTTPLLPSSTNIASGGRQQDTSKTGQHLRTHDSPLGPRQNVSLMSIGTNADLSVKRTDQGKSIRPAKRKRDFEKELTQLLHGGGSLTDAPPIPQRQSDGPLTRASKKLKTETVQEAQRETRNKVTTSKEEPAVKRAKAVAPPEPIAAESSDRTANAVRKVPAASVVKSKGPKGKARRIKTPVLKQPLPSSGTSMIQVSNTHPLPASKEQPAPARSPLPSKVKDNLDQGHEQNVPRRRRRILQDDTMEEFLAKCKAAMES